MVWRLHLDGGGVGHTRQGGPEAVEVLVKVLSILVHSVEYLNDLFLIFPNLGFQNVFLIPVLFIEDLELALIPCLDLGDVVLEVLDGFMES